VDFEAYAGEAMGLVGANGAGKSTLMNVLGGVISEDAGVMKIDGSPVTIHSPADAMRLGIAFVHQEMTILPTLSIVDNMYISRFPIRSGLIDYARAKDLCRAVLARLGCDFDLDILLRNLSPGDQQLVEIGRALLLDPRIIIFDEPTSSLTSRERQRLFDAIQALKQQQVTIIYITHFLDEVFDVCERATILRNGETVGTGLIKDLTREDMVRMMIGEVKLDTYYAQQTAQAGDVALSVQGLRRRGVLQDISFELRFGEVVGLWGLLGSGRTELARAIMGLDPIDSGELYVRHRKNGKLVRLKPGQAKQYIGMITENRREEGLLLPISVKQNMSLANLKALTSIGPFVDARKETGRAREYVERLHIMLTSLDQPVATLSGGNQQKVVVGRWLQRNPIIYMMDEPTRGLDVGAKAEIRTLIHELAEAGAAILAISSDIEEIMVMSHRFLVMNRGRIVEALPRDATALQLMTSASGA
jgi:ABC-type sugar transport system ATPase subunit